MNQIFIGECCKFYDRQHTHKNERQLHGSDEILKHIFSFVGEKKDLPSAGFNAGRVLEQHFHGDVKNLQLLSDRIGSLLEDVFHALHDPNRKKADGGHASDGLLLNIPDDGSRGVDSVLKIRYVSKC